jgi:small subunit ribosomal protein S1
MKQNESRRTIKRLTTGADAGELDRLLNDALSGLGDFGQAVMQGEQIDFKPQTIVKGRVVRVKADAAMVDIKYKADGEVSLIEWGDNPPAVGDEVEVYLESISSSDGTPELSKRRADRIRGWERIVATYKEGDVVKGVCTRKIKGGLLMDIGFPVFLPASQIEIRRAGDINAWMGKEVEARIIKIDAPRMNIVASRRKLLEETREKKKQDLLASLAENQVRRGVVKNIAEFGAFVDLGGIDGLLHITDMSWGRINHPADMLAIDEVLDVMVLKFDKDSERIALGLKQKTPSPWENIEARYTPGTRMQGEVVTVMNYGAFVKLEEGVEGLVHVSEMSWTRRVNHPNEIVNPGDIVDVVVLSVNAQKQEVSLGMKQTEENPWDQVQGRYPVGTIIRGRVRNLTNYGAFIEIEEGIDGLLHVSDMSWTRKVGHPSEMLKKGQEIEAIVLSVDQEKRRVALGMKQLKEDPWEYDIPNRFLVGADLEGRVTKVTNFGVFVSLEDELEGLLHISELSETKVDNPEEVVTVGDLLRVKVIKVNQDDRKIGLTLLEVLESAKGKAPESYELMDDVDDGTTKAEETATPEG